jgi:hypothetical protein
MTISTPRPFPLTREHQVCHRETAQSGHSRWVHVCIHRRRRDYLDEAHDGAKHVRFDIDSTANRGWRRGSAAEYTTLPSFAGTIACIDRHECAL